MVEMTCGTLPLVAREAHGLLIFVEKKTLLLVENEAHGLSIFVRMSCN